MLCFGTPVWADRIRRGGDAGMAGGSLLVAIGEQGLNSLAVAVSFGDEGTDVGGLFTGELGAAGGAGGSAKLGTKAGAAALGTKALAEACVVLSLARARCLAPFLRPAWIRGGGRVARAVRALLAASSAIRDAAAAAGDGAAALRRRGPAPRSI